MSRPPSAGLRPIRPTADGEMLTVPTVSASRPSSDCTGLLSGASSCTTIRARPGSAVLTQQRTGLDQIGQTLLGAVARAYEPMLEKHIGRPVVLTMVNPADDKKRRLELPGYLVDYSDKYVAVFNVSHDPLEQIELVVAENIERPGLSVGLAEAAVTITSTGPDVLVVQSVAGGGQRRDLHVALLPGATLRLPREDDGLVTIRAQRTRQLDIVCPRSVGTVLFGGDPTIARAEWRGLAPQQTDEAV